MSFFKIFLSNIIASMVAVYVSAKLKKRSDIRIYIFLMLGGFVWSQIQTEYLIKRIKTNTQQALDDEVIKDLAMGDEELEKFFK